MIKWGDIELPGFDRPLRPVGAKRRRIFAAFLEGLVAEVSRPRKNAAERPTKKPEATRLAERVRGVPRPLLQQGRQRRLSRRTRHRASLGAASALEQARLMQLYLDAIPKKAFADSCIFHAERGCSLPRSLRAPVSEAYLCGPLMRLMKR